MAARFLREIAKDLLIVLAWLAGALVIGGYIAEIDGNHGSIVYVIIGFWAGLAAGAVHVIIRIIAAIVRRSRRKPAPSESV